MRIRAGLKQRHERNDRPGSRAKLGAPMTPLLPVESQARQWAMIAHLSFFANLWIPFGGVIAATLIYTLRKDEEAVARENQRNALNFEITMTIFNVLGLVVYVGLFFTMFAGVALHAKQSALGPVFPWQFSAIFAFIAIFLSISLAAAITAGFAARAAWLGRVFRYPVAIPFVR
jgi:uncharacterized Tic20 family protein